MGQNAPAIADIVTNSGDELGRHVYHSNDEAAKGLAQAVADRLNTSAANTAVKIQDEINSKIKDNIVRMDNISSATVSMIRHAFARQLRAENLARSGVFYPDVLMMNWGTAPSYEILGLPKY